MEIWKAIPEFENYEASTLGRIKRSKPGKGALVGNIITGRKNKKGYYRVQFSKNGKTKHYFIHRLIAITFIPNPENKPEVNHINGNKVDNRIENLEWATTSENIQHAIKIDLRKSPLGEKHFRSKFTENQILEIIKLDKSGWKRKDIAKKYNVANSTISSILKGHNWNHFTKNKI